ncbi:MAG: tail fiber protein [Erythrobacter sp.]|uniref:phage tail protein n=1 Tax=Erythrobacter sp. TaxID=1042 RepID=UPI0025E7701B|nr:tail fiber protein [Erythrobacter sp.]MCL9999651.1 tail fiber protein [Erythrobacter sp.]
MSNAFIGEIRLFGGTFAPRGWAFCDGRLLAIANYDTLFALIGTTYGGDGVNTFAVPDLRSRVPLSQGQGGGLSDYAMGQTGGTEQVLLDASQIPAHQHGLNATAATGAAMSPGSTVMLATPVESGATPSLYVVPGTSGVNPAPMAPQSISMTGGNQPHSNMMPTQAINYIIATEGLWPARN